MYLVSTVFQFDEFFKLNYNIVKKKKTQLITVFFFKLCRVVAIVGHFWKHDDILSQKYRHFNPLPSRTHD